MEVTSPSPNPFCAMCSTPSNLKRGPSGVLEADQFVPWLFSEGHAWCESRSFAAVYDTCMGEVEVTLSNYEAELAEISWTPSPGFACLFCVATCRLHVHELGTGVAVVGREIGRFSPLTLTIEWYHGAPFGLQTWTYARKVPGHSILVSLKEDSAVVNALDGLDFTVGDFRSMTEVERRWSFESCHVVGVAHAPARDIPKAVVVVAPSAGGKTTVAKALAPSFGIEWDRVVMADGAVFREGHEQYTKVCANGKANNGLWSRAWPAAKTLVQSMKKEVIEAAIANRQDLVLSDTGQDVKSLKALMRHLREAGFVVCLLGVYANAQEIFDRGVKREVADGKRYNRNFKKIQATFDSFIPAIQATDGPFKLVLNQQGHQPVVMLEGTGTSGDPLSAALLHQLELLWSQCST